MSKNTHAIDTATAAETVVVPTEEIATLSKKALAFKYGKRALYVATAGLVVAVVVQAVRDSHDTEDTPETESTED